LSFQFADFPQYIALFIVGLVAYRKNWLVSLPARTGRVWLAIAAILILLYPPIVILSGAIADAAPFLGGWNWQAMLAALWQSFLGIAMCVSVIYLFQSRLDRQGALGRFLSRNAYTVYLIHEPVITFIALLAIGVTLYPLLKFGLAALVALPLCFGLSSLIRRLPHFDRVL
jgi:surface polysaccharide O-acyltransferase-like enzyme